MLRFPRIIYFIKSPLITAEERKDALNFGNNVVFRNAAFVADDEPLEECAGVAGAVPNRYKNIKHGKQVVSDFLAENSVKDSDDAKNAPPVIVPPIPQQKEQDGADGDGWGKV